MAKGSPFRLLLIVTGSTLRAEEMDRPLGYYLKQRIEQSLNEATSAGRHGLEDYIVRVVADFRWMHDEPLQSLPTISLGGPGVNALAHRWLEEVPVSLAYSERYFIQMDPDLSRDLAPASGVWTTTRHRSPFPCSSIDSCQGSWNAAPQVPHTSPRSMATTSPDLRPTTTTMTTTTIDQRSEIAVDHDLLVNREPFRD